jgi:cytosine/adenosine deaminase-related metal-dependent hydrolase
MLVYTARWVLPVTRPPIRDGAVAILDERVVDTGPASEVLGRHPGSHVRRLGSAVLMPGLVNAHTHLELSWMAASVPRGADYTAWVRALIVRRQDEELTEARRRAEEAAAVMVARGTVGVGDIGNLDWSAGVLARSGMHGVHFHEIFGFRAADGDRLFADAVRVVDEVGESDGFRDADERVRVAITPHAPHTTSPALLRSIARRAASSGDPLSIHVAESAAEVALLQAGSGPFADLLRERAMWDDDWSPAGRTPVAHLDQLGVLTAATLAVHCVRVGAADIQTLQKRGVTVVTCPRSNERLGVGTAPVSRFLSAGIPVAIGTDSLASAPDLDLFAEMAALRESDAGIPPRTLVRMATWNGAAALRLSQLGSIEAGKLARLIVVQLDTEQEGRDPFEAVCSRPARVHPLTSAPREVST